MLKNAATILDCIHMKLLTHDQSQHLVVTF